MLVFSSQLFIFLLCFLLTLFLDSSPLTETFLTAIYTLVRNLLPNSVAYCFVLEDFVMSRQIYSIAGSVYLFFIGQ